MDTSSGKIITVFKSSKSIALHFTATELSLRRPCYLFVQPKPLVMLQGNCLRVGPNIFKKCYLI